MKTYFRSKINESAIPSPQKAHSCNECNDDERLKEANDDEDFGVRLHHVKHKTCAEESTNRC